MISIETMKVIYIICPECPSKCLSSYLTISRRGDLLTNSGTAAQKMAPNCALVGDNEPVTITGNKRIGRVAKVYRNLQDMVILTDQMKVDLDQSQHIDSKEYQRKKHEYESLVKAHEIARSWVDTHRSDKGAMHRLANQQEFKDFIDTIRGIDLDMGG
jgi:hypothetical protein